MSEKELVYISNRTESCDLKAEKPEPSEFLLSKRDKIFALIFLICSVLLSAIGFWGGFKIGYSFSAIMLLISGCCYFWDKKAKISAFPLVCLVLAFLLLIGFSVTSNGSVLFLSLVASCFLAAVWFLSASGNDFEKGDLGVIKSVLRLAFKKALPNIPKSLIACFQTQSEKSFAFGKMLIGVGISLPLLFVIVPLLMSSDEAFNGLANRLVGNIFSSIIKLAVGLLVFAFFLSFNFSLKKDTTKYPRKSEFKGIDTTVIASFLTAISVCYFTYLFSQLAYFTGAFRGFLPEGYDFTAAEYARRGFFEMTVIAAINFGVIFIVLLVCRKNEGKLPLALKILCSFIGFFTLIIITTALSKMVLYISRFGMTELRITTSAFMLFLFIVFISLILRLFVKKISVIKTSFVTAGLILSLLGIANVNGVIADYNYNAYKSGNLDSIDVFTLYELGEEGIPYLAELTRDDNYEISEDAKARLEEIILWGGYYELDVDYTECYSEYTVTGKTYSFLYQLNIPTIRTYEVLDEYIEDNPEILYKEIENSYVYPDEYF